LRVSAGQAVTAARSGAAVPATWSALAVSSSRRQEVTFGRRRSSARRSRSVMPPQTPHSIWLSSASARHSVRTGQPVHSCLALFCSAPRTKSSSGCAFRHAALGVQSSIHICLPCHLRENLCALRVAGRLSRGPEPFPPRRRKVTILRDGGVQVNDSTSIVRND